ncbi:MAG: hypothetical protein K2W95_28180 [Candidatus Obscuribacterales bacterium]|nr:hypothetical protein [Candidatus Obscuribacterales bacterium]
MQKTKYVITRIIGNELPPRDRQGSRLGALKFIVENEYVASDASRLWLLNRVLDSSLLSELKQILDLAGERYVEESVDWKVYIAAFSRNARLTALININKARNRCFEEGRQLADFVMVLDGDCFFDKQAWIKSTNFIVNDQLTNVDRKYYAHSSHRLILDSPLPVDQGKMKLEEPMLVFRADADRLFDESLPFGIGDKQELLSQLGLRRVGESWLQPELDSLAALGGFVLHLQTGSSEVESDFRVRIRVRNESLNILLKKADRLAELELLRGKQWWTLFKFKLCRCLAELLAAPKKIKQMVKRLIGRRK